MANHKVKESKKRLPVTLTVEAGNYQKFRKYCIDNELTASRVIDDLIVKFLKGRKA